MLGVKLAFLFNIPFSLFSKLVPCISYTCFEKQTNLQNDMQWYEKNVGVNSFQMIAIVRLGDCVWFCFYVSDFHIFDVIILILQWQIKL